MEHVMSFVARSNLTSFAVWSRYTDMITLDNVVQAQISVEEGKKCFEVFILYSWTWAHQIN